MLLAQGRQLSERVAGGHSAGPPRLEDRTHVDRSWRSRGVSPARSSAGGAGISSGEAKNRRASLVTGARASRSARGSLTGTFVAGRSLAGSSLPGGSLTGVDSATGVGSLAAVGSETRSTAWAGVITRSRAWTSAAGAPGRGSARRPPRAARRGSRPRAAPGGSRRPRARWPASQRARGCRRARGQARRLECGPGSGLGFRLANVLGFRLADRLGGDRGEPRRGTSPGLRAGRADGGRRREATDCSGRGSPAGEAVRESLWRRSRRVIEAGCCASSSFSEVHWVIATLHGRTPSAPVRGVLRTLCQVLTWESGRVRHRARTVPACGRVRAPAGASELQVGESPQADQRLP